MARLQPRASSAAKIGADDEDVRQLDQARLQNDLKLKTRFERIFRKYEHNFVGVGDEIDLHSGEIVVDNGHLRNMRDEADPGKSASSRFVRNFQENLEHEIESEEGEEEQEDEEDSEVSGDGDGESVSDDGDNTSESTIEPFRALKRPPPRLAQLLVGSSGAGDENDDETSQDVSAASDVTATGTSTGLLEQVPALRDSMSALTGRSRRSAVDADTIQALGTSIANQLAQLMVGPSSRKKHKSRATSRRDTTDPVWDYPDINTTHRLKRKRSPSPVASPPVSSPPMASPGQRSLWAPSGFRKSKRPQQAATPSLRRTRSSIIPSSAVRGSDVMRCTNCSFSNSATWQVGPGGGILCASCGKYYEHHGRMKPFDSPTPSIEDLNPSSDPSPETDLGDSATAILPITEEETLVEPLAAPELVETPLHEIQNLLIERPPPPVSSPVRESTHAASSEATASPQLSMPSRQVELKPQGQEFSPYRIDTPQTYSANTSRGLRHTPRFSVEDDALIIKLKEQDDLPWHKLALQLQPRTLFSIQNHYSRALFKQDCPGRDLFNAQLRDKQNVDAALLQDSTLDAELEWSHEQDELLYELRKDKELGWADIAIALPGRSIEAVEVRYSELVKKGQRKEQLLTARQCRPWKPHEDALILRLKEVDNLAWHHVAERFQERSLQSIQKRYARVLAPDKRRRAPSDLTRGTAEEIMLEADPDLAMHLTPGRGRALPFQPAEDELIRILVGTAKGKGIDWEGLASQLPGRSVRSVFVRYKDHISKVEPPSLASQPRTPNTATPAHQPIRWCDHSPSLGSNIRRTDLPPNYNEQQYPVPLNRHGLESRVPFTQPEDEIIMQLKASHNASWEEISSQLPGRSANAISLRFSEMLRSIPVGSTNHATSTFTHQIVPSPQPLTPARMPAYRRFTSEENDMILHFHSQGISWDNMARYFNDRAPASLQDHWYTIIRPRARKSLPAPTNTGDLLRTALGNSRRRSEVYPRARNYVPSVQSGHGEGKADDPIMIEDESFMSEISEQLHGELHSSVVQEPTLGGSQIDPQLLELDRAAAKAQRYQRLMTAVEQYAAQRNNRFVVQRVHDTYHRNVDDPRLQKLLELTSSNSFHAPSEVEWALDAFDIAHVQIGRVERGSGASMEVEVSDVIHTQVSGKGKGKEKALENSATVAPASLPISMPASGRMLPPASMPAPFYGRSRASIARPPSQRPEHSSEVIRGPAIIPSQAQISSANPGDGTRLRFTHSSAQTPASADPQPPAKPRSNGCRQNKALLRASSTTGNHKMPATTATSNEQATNDPAISTRTISTGLVQRQPDYVSEEVSDIPTPAENSYHELPHKAVITQSRPMHFKKSSQPVQQRRGIERPLKRVEAADPVGDNPDDDYTIPCSDGNAAEDNDSEEENITVKQPPKKRGRPRKRPKDFARDLAPKMVVLQARTATDRPTRGHLRKHREPSAAQEEPASSKAPTIDLTLEIADSDGVDGLSSTPVRKSPPQEASSGKKVRFVDMVEVRGPARDSATVASPILNKRTQIGQESDTREPEGSSSSPSRIQTAAPPNTTKVQAAAPSSSPVFMKAPVHGRSRIEKLNVSGTPVAKQPIPPLFPKPAGPSSNSTIHSQPSSSPAPTSAPFPSAKSRLTRLRRESTAAVVPPETPKMNWPRRHSTPTAFFSHRASPAPGREDRFGFGRKRVVETPVRELASRRDVEEDELA